MRLVSPMASSRSSLALLAALLLAPAGPTAAAPPKGPLAAACPDCPDGAVFIGCTQGNATMTLAFPPGMKTGFTMKGWKSMLKVTATRTSDAVLHLELQSPGPGGVGKEKAVTLRIGETVTVVPGKDVDVAAVGGNRAPVRCAWLE